MSTGTAKGNNGNLVNFTNTPVVGSVVLTRSLVNIMDVGMLQFAITIAE